jgi:hypothetical protein
MPKSHKTKGGKSVKSKTPNKEIAKYISVYKSSGIDLAKYSNAHELVKYLKDKPDRAIKILNHLFDFGFIMEEQTYYIRGSGVLGKHWTQGLETVIEKAETLPRIYAAINNIWAEVQTQIERLKIEYSCWAGGIWDLKRTHEHGLYDATTARMNAYIENQSEGVELKNTVADLKAISLKLRGLSMAITMQHQAVIAILYQSKRTSDIFQDALGSMMNRISEDEDVDTSTIAIDSDELEIDDKSIKKRRRRNRSTT